MDYHKLLLTAFSTFDVLNPKLLFSVNLTSCFLIPFMPFILPLFPCIDVLMCLSLPLLCTKKHHSAVRVKTEPKKPLNVRNVNLLFIIFVTPWPALGAITVSVY